MREARNQWAQRGAADYDIEVEVARKGSRRKSRIEVRDGHIRKGEVRFWNERNGLWLDRTELNEDQSRPFTVDGLFQTVLEALDSGQRPWVRMRTTGDPPRPEVIVLSDVVDESGLREGTKTTLRVRSFRVRE